MINKFKDWLGIENNQKYKLTKEIKFENSVMKDLANEYDHFGSLSKKLGKELEKVCDFKNYAIGIHCSGYSHMGTNTINDAFTNGLKNNGNNMVGANTNRVNIGDTISWASNFTILIGMLKSVYDYKYSEGAFIIKIPKNYIEDNLDFNQKPEKPIFFLGDNSIPRLLPEYIYGYIPTDQQGNLGEMVHNKNYKDIHDYKDNELLRDGDKINPNLKHW